MLSDVVTTPLPSGPFKIVVDGGPIYSAVEVLQFNGPSATALQVGYDTQSSMATEGSVRPSVRQSRVVSRPTPVFRALPLAGMQ
jgi:hypothetical protein